MIQKQIVYLPIEGKSIDELMECKEGYFLTYEQLNEYTANVIRKALEIACMRAEMRLLIDEENDIVEEANIDNQSIINTFEETFKKFEV